jgi:hypothetical protein
MATWPSITTMPRRLNQHNKQQHRQAQVKLTTQATDWENVLVRMVVIEPFFFFIVIKV